MAALATLTDTFNDGIIGAVWGNSYGGALETGGRGRLPCVTGSYSGYQTAKDWTLANSSIYIQVPTVPAVSTSVTECQIVFSLIINSPAGTYLAFNINVKANTIRFESNVAYADGAAVSLTFNATNHKWLRFRETGGNVLWDTSVDGSTWTNRRTLATPAWVTSTANINDIAVDIWSFRDAGVTDFAEIDNCNVLTGGAVFQLAATATAGTAATATATRRAILTATGTADTAATATPTAMFGMTATGSATTHADAAVEGDDSDPTTTIGSPRTGWEVSAPWT